MCFYVNLVIHNLYHYIYYIYIHPAGQTKIREKKKVCQLNDFKWHYTTQFLDFLPLVF